MQTYVTFYPCMHQLNGGFKIQAGSAYVSMLMPAVDTKVRHTHISPTLRRLYVKKPEADQRAAKFYPLTDAELGHRKPERKSPWLLRLLSSSILWPFTHCGSITERFSLLGKQGNRKTADRSNCWHFSGRFLRRSGKLARMWRRPAEGAGSTSSLHLSARKSHPGAHLRYCANWTKSVKKRVTQL